ncbi:MAG: hypothetical protein ABR572_00925 [Cryomorphaceae bacterium]|nr:hypothetical protein [Flavobacteriales bacterium]
MKRKITVYILTLLVAAFSANTAFAQEKRQKTKKQYKEFKKLQDDREGEYDKKMEEGRKRHLKLQDKKTQKRMKRQKRKSARIQRNKHKNSFFRRLFTKKPKGR